MYFPEYAKDKYPERFFNIFIKMKLIFRAYLLNVLNTVRKDSIHVAIMKLKKLRKKGVVNEAPITMTSQFAELLE